MQYLNLDKYRNALLLLARVLISVLFVIYGWNKLMGFQGTVGYMTSLGTPLPTLAAAIAVIAELIFGIAIVLGFYTRPLALILAVYTVGTAVIGHAFWGMEGAAAAAATIGFYKNISIAGGFLFLAVAGPGAFSIDRK